MNVTEYELQMRLAAIVESSDDGIVSKNLHGVVQSWNAAAERIFGYSAHEMVGKPISTIIPEDRQDEEPAILERLKRGERVDHFQTIRMRKDRNLIEVSVTISPIKDASGNVIGASKIVRDITEFRRLQRERDELLVAERAARTESERANRAKDEFIATLSHELRTPLNAILGWVQLIGTSPSDVGMINEGLAVIERNARAQTQLIEDLLDMGRIISGKMRLDAQVVDPSLVVLAALESIKPAADARHISLHKVFDSHAGLVAGDANRLQQVVWNLLTNAVKFTPEGGKIEVLLAQVKSHVEITVRDTGRGIKPEFLPYVFDRFRQSDSSTTREHGGLGIGLAIVKHLVELHGGKVRVRSPGEGLGTVFSVELPVMRVKEKQPQDHLTADSAQPSAVLDVASLEGVKVLLVDDEPDARDLLSRLLQNHRANVTTAGSVNEALELIRYDRPDVVVSDIGMPHNDGYAFIRELRRLSIPHGARIPAIALTAFARPEDRTRALVSGYQMHIAKPVDAQELVAAISSLLERTQYKDHVEKEANRPPANAVVRY
jgi:PAS domain S-box-containing protein